MSGFRNFGIVGVGHIGGYILEQLLKAKSSAIIDKVVVLARPVCIDSLPRAYFMSDISLGLCREAAVLRFEGCYHGSY